MSYKNISEKELRAAIDNSLTMSEAAQKLNLQFSTFKRKAKKFNLYKPNQGGKGTKKNRKPVYLLENILAGKHPQFQTYKLKQRMLKAGLIKNECSICGFKGLWNGKPINMILDHINGIRYDHRKENLRMVCPMCDSQLSTFKSKNI